MRRFELQEGTSSQFWEIDQKGSSFTVCFGRLGAEGESETTDCGSADDARAEVAQLIREKTRKGYREITGAPRAAVDGALEKPTHYDTLSHPTHFAGYVLVDFDPEAGGLEDLDHQAYAVRTDYDGGAEDFAAKLDALLDDPKIGRLRALVIGQWDETSFGGPHEAIEKLIAARARLTSLEALFLGDVVQEESEISWMEQCNLRPLLDSLPNLRELVTRGGNGLGFPGLKHANLQTLIVQSGGLPAQCVRELAASDLPNLQRVALWLGTDGYGGDAKLEDLEPILQGQVWPRLEYLGLMNSEMTDEIAEAIVDAPILERVRALDLSMGTLSDKGALALLASPRIKRLELLNLRRHYMTPEVMAQFAKLGIEVDVSDREEDDEYIHCEVSE